MTGCIVLAVFLFLCMLASDSLFQKRKKKKDIPAGVAGQKKQDSASILGKSKYHFCQWLPNDATNEKTVESIKRISEEDSTFVPPKKENDSGLPAPEVILERDGGLTEEEEEEIKELFGKDAAIACGVSVEEMFRTGKVIENRQSPAGEEENAGKILYENRGTDVFEQPDNRERLERIRSLMFLHEKKYELTGISETSETKNTDYTNFDITDFIC
jgi:hypothetical protein